MKKRIVTALIVCTMLMTTACSFGGKVSEEQLREEIRAELYNEVRSEVESEVRQSLSVEIEKRAKELIAEGYTGEEEIDTPDVDIEPIVVDPDVTGDDTNPVVEANDNKAEIEELMVQASNLYSEGNSQVKTANINTIDEQILELNTYDFSGKKITFLGDSITYGVGSTTVIEGQRKSYVYFLQEVLGCEVKSYCVPGGCIGRYSDFIVPSFTSSIPDDTDILVVMAGFNDFSNFNGNYSDDSMDEGSFKGEVNYFMNILRNHVPDKPIYFVTIYQNVCEDGNESVPLVKFMNYIKEAAPNYDIRIIDLYGEGFMDNHDDTSQLAYFNDVIHPNENGYMLLGHHIAAHLVADQWSY